MTRKDKIRRLNELARQYPADDKEQVVSNLANHTLNILLGKEGKFEGEDRRAIEQISEAIIKIGAGLFPEGDPDENLEKKTHSKSLGKGQTGRGEARATDKSRKGRGI